MAVSRWEDNVHFWDYSPESPELYPGMDAYRTGDAYIYNENHCAYGIVTVVTGLEIDLKGVVLQDAIKHAQIFLKDMTRPGSGTLQDEAKALKAHQTLLFTWNGSKIRQIFP